MKKYTKISILFLTFIFVSSNLISKNFIWEVKSKTTTVYILGSIHIGKEGSFPLASVIENAFESSKYLAVEVDIDSVNPMSLMKYMMYSDGTTLKSKLKPEIYKEIKSKFDKLGLPELVYGKLKPWAAMIMAEQLSMQSKGLSADNGIDKYFMNKARNKKKIISLETAEYQFSILDEFDKISNEYLEFSMKDLEDNNSKIDNMFKAWKEGNADEILKIINGEEDGFPEYKKIMEKLLYQRNENMVEKIKTYLNTNEVYFVVVGAGHLVGDRGIISLLNKLNQYKIEQK